MSSSKLPFLLFFIVIIALVGGIFLMSSHKIQKPVATQTGSAIQTISPTPSPILPAGTSNTQLDQDTTQIDNSMNSYNNDATAVDQGLNDQQTNLQ